jgi:hypothetical protein
MANNGPRDIQSDRNSKAAVKMRRKLRQRNPKGMFGALEAPDLVEQVKSTRASGPDHSAQMRSAWRRNRTRWLEVTEEYYNHTLNALPPLGQRSRGHIMGSAFGHDASGWPVWFCFLEVYDRNHKTHYLGRICTIREWINTYHKATYEALTLIQPRTCDECNGNGKDPGQSSYPEPCPVCNGRGTMYNATEF